MSERYELFGDPLTNPFWTCLECGCIVGDSDIHDRVHDAVNLPTPKDVKFFGEHIGPRFEPPEYLPLAEGETYE